MKLLDLYCGAGGCSAGYVQAGFEVTGVDINPQPKYPFRFFQGDAIEFLLKHGHEYEAIHASPPCQAYSLCKRTAKEKEYPELVELTREVLQRLGAPYVIENVPGAPLHNPILLCGTMFDLKLYRHRLFETSFPVPQLHHRVHTARQVKMGRKPKQGEFIQVVGHFSGVEQAKEAMEIYWMGGKELAQAIPPSYTRYIGTYLKEYLLRRRNAA